MKLGPVHSSSKLGRKQSRKEWLQPSGDSPAHHLTYTDSLKTQAWLFHHCQTSLFLSTPEAWQYLTLQSPAPWTWQQLRCASGHAKSITVLTGLSACACISHWSSDRIHGPSALSHGAWSTRCCPSSLVLDKIYCWILLSPKTWLGEEAILFLLGTHKSVFNPHVAAALSSFMWDCSPWPPAHWITLTIRVDLHWNRINSVLRQRNHRKEDGCLTLFTACYPVAVTVYSRP